ncbi:hypothetical protein LTR35_000049 [Friedmanniomyces endolithicus]|uniref:Ribosomal protein bL31m N-terminal domain-containing protein n=1 Tax=Friedmanniomyces endolithicus TaxID=329885 RepID=A0AAN6FIN9_9PEZI|nr:hypothetical protein LTS00_008694 [Friedmanniomyces endolithicus]KAK0293445.1 hypothetical protein LTR35_000049 [Friedmanniomyces endolithicus]KAK0318979.1 hypothetical protein LTR82_010079 [Friedmanniomyces endolithicus]KAK0997413.1 hypothetical protein LTR54_009873 [Friedmanniomyces endolithicus]
MHSLHSRAHILKPSLRTPYNHTQTRHASLLRRPIRPYTFTQLITLSDGSTFTHRTTSPQPIYKSTRDTKNSVVWNPSSRKLLNVEEDEAGRLRRFRKRFGRGFDVDAEEKREEGPENTQQDEGVSGEPAQEEESLMDLIAASAAQQQQASGKKAAAVEVVGGVREPAKKNGKGKGGQK